MGVGLSRSQGFSLVRFLPGKVQDGVSLAKGWSRVGQRGERFPTTSSSARQSVVVGSLIYFLCAMTYVGFESCQPPRMST